jgi:hypothetical protein
MIEQQSYAPAGSKIGMCQQPDRQYEAERRRQHRQEIWIAYGNTVLAACDTKSVSQIRELRVIAVGAECEQLSRNRQPHLA